MNVSELYKLTFWIQKEIVDKGVPGKYQALQNVLQKNVQRSQQQQPFEDKKDALIKTIKAVPLDRLTIDQITFLTELGIAERVGQAGVEMVEDVLYKNVIDMATAAKKIQESFDAITLGITKTKQLQSGLEGCVTEEEYEANNEVLIRVNFSGDAEMSNVQDFKSWGSVWFDIGRGIAMAHELTPQDVRVIGATKGSVVLELSTVTSIAGTVGTIIYAGLKLAEKVMDLRIKAQELQSMKLKNEGIARNLEKEADDQKGAGIKEISSEIVGSIGLDESSEGDKVQALEKSIKSLIEFVEKGGQLDFVFPEVSSDNEQGEEEKKEMQDLRLTYKEIRKLEKTIKLIDHKKT